MSDVAARLNEALRGHYRLKRELGQGGMATVYLADDLRSGRKVAFKVLKPELAAGGLLALGIAERLTGSEYVAYTKEARADPADRTRWTPGQPSVVRPSERPGFRGPVVELTGPLTISAGETFTQALMGRTPAIARVGEHTQGVFSDTLARHLPNGWVFWLPNEVFRTAEGTTFDGPGIPPTHPAPVFSPADLEAGRDPGLDRALALLAAP